MSAGSVTVTAAGATASMPSVTYNSGISAQPGVTSQRVQMMKLL